MRDKQVILEEIHIHKLKAPALVTTASLPERVTIEVLIDIRDELSTIINVLISLREEMQHLP